MRRGTETTHGNLIGDNCIGKSSTYLVGVPRVEVAEANGGDDALRLQLGQYFDDLDVVWIRILIPMKLK